MGFKWNTQPYQTLKELRDNYLTFTTVTTRRESMALAEEATQWMRDNAPWQDRTGRARAGLSAFVIGGKSEAARESRELAQAKTDDAELLKILNDARNQRRRAAKIGIAKAIRAGKITSTQDLSFPARMELGKLGKPLTSVPKSQSFVAQTQKLQAGRYPLVSIKFKSNPRLRYTIHLELGMGGRYSIIGPALDYWGPKLMLKVQRIANLKQYQGTIDFAEVQSQEDIFERRVMMDEAFMGESYRRHTPEFQQQSVGRAVGTRRRKRASGDSRRKHQR